MKRIIAIGFMLALFGCTTKTVAPAVSMPASVITEPTKEELEEQVRVEKRKLLMAQFEEYVNKESIEMMEFFSAKVGKLMFFKPVADQKIRAEAHQFPEDEDLNQIVGENNQRMF